MDGGHFAGEGPLFGDLLNFLLVVPCFFPNFALPFTGDGYGDPWS